jgi:hypothetical protein
LPTWIAAATIFDKASTVLLDVGLENLVLLPGPAALKNGKDLADLVFIQIHLLQFVEHLVILKGVVLVTGGLNVSQVGRLRRVVVHKSAKSIRSDIHPAKASGHGIRVITLVLKESCEILHVLVGQARTFLEKHRLQGVGNDDSMDRRIPEVLLPAHGILGQGLFSVSLVLCNGLSVGTTLLIVLSDTSLRIHHLYDGIQVERRGEHLLV